MKNKYLTEKERFYIELSLKNKKPIKIIAKDLGKHPSTIYREIKRGMTEQLDSTLKVKEVYLADVGQRVQQENCSKKGRGLAIGNDCELSAFIEKKIVQDKLSPEAVCLYINKNQLTFKNSVCYKTIYNYIDKGYFQLLTNKHLPVKKKPRRKIKKTTVSLKNVLARSIEDRPNEVSERNSFGHWELDTVIGKREGAKTCLLVLSERYTRKEIIRKIPNKKAHSVIMAFDNLEREYGLQFKNVFKTITCDNGPEFSDTQGMERSIKNKKQRTVIYYCHPYSSCERGTNENINKMIRRWYPKGTDFADISNEDIKACEDWINNYPRKIFGGLSSNEFYMQNVQ